MDNPWALTREQREQQRASLARHAEALRAVLADPRFVRLWDHCLEDLIIQAHDHGEVEAGTIFALIRIVINRGGAEGRDRILAALVNIAADYGTGPGPTFSVN